MLMYCWPFEINPQGALSCKCKAPPVSAKRQRGVSIRGDCAPRWLQAGLLWHLVEVGLDPDPKTLGSDFKDGPYGLLHLCPVIITTATIRRFDLRCLDILSKDVFLFPLVCFSSSFQSTRVLFIEWLSLLTSDIKSSECIHNKWKGHLQRVIR